MALTKALSDLDTNTWLKGWPLHTAGFEAITQRGRTAHSAVPGTPTRHLECSMAQGDGGRVLVCKQFCLLLCGTPWRRA